MGLASELNTFSKKCFAAAVLRMAESRTSMVCPVESTARYRYSVLTFHLYICLVNTVALVRAFEMRPATLAQLWRIGLNPTPDTTGIHFDASLWQEFGDS
jgi:hypothetical protein